MAKIRKTASIENGLMEILKILNAKEYISPQGAKDYLQNDGFNKITNTKINIISKIEAAAASPIRKKRKPV